MWTSFICYNFWSLSLSLSQRNIFPPENELYVKIKEMMAASDPMKKNNSEEEGLGE